MKFDSVNPQPTNAMTQYQARLKGSWFSQVTFPNPLPNVCGLSHVGDLVKFSPAIIPSDPSKLCPGEGRHTGGNATRSTCSPIQQTFNGLTSPGATKDLLVFKRAMSFTCPVKLKSLWR